MHISEGVLSAPVLITGAVTTAVGVTVGLKGMEDKAIPKTAIISSALFIASLIHIPLGPTNLHLVLNGMAGIVLGWQAFPAFLVALFLQGVLFQFGGITVLGINTFNLALPAIASFYLFKLLMNFNQADSELVLGVVAFICGAIAVFLSAVMLSVSLVFTSESFLEVAKLAVVSQLPLIIVEGIISAFIVIFIKKIKPEILE